jgi:hypothetical protein
MNRLIKIGLFLAMTMFITRFAHAQTYAVIPVNFCYQAGVQAQISGLQSNNFMQGVVPSCTVTVYLTGTTTLANIYSNGTGTPLDNPFKAASNGFIQPTYAAINVGYDVQLSGGVCPNCYTTPLTISGVYPSTGIVIPQTVTSFSGDGALLSNVNSTGNVTATLANANGYKVWGNCTSSTGAPSYCSIVNAMLPTSGVTAGSYTNANLTVNSQGIVTSASNGSGGSTAFSSLTSGTNTGAAMIVGSGASLSTSGLGTIAATSLTALSGLPSQAHDTVVMNASGSSASPTAVAMPTCTSGADLYNTTTHSWSCVSTGGGGSVNPGSNYAIPSYPSTSGTTLNPANITTDASLNDIFIPGYAAIGSSPPTSPCSGVTGCWAAGEGSTAGTPTTNVDYIRANSANHKFVYSVDGTSELDLVGMGITHQWFGAGGGTAQAQTVTVTPAITAYVAGMTIKWYPSNANTSGSPTLNVNSIGAATITKCGGNSVIANDLLTTAEAIAEYDSGGDWELQNPQAAGCGIQNSTFTVGTGTITANTCTSSSTVTMNGVLSTSAFFVSPDADVSGVTGWGANGGLVIDAWPTTNTLNYKVCNQTAGSITPSSSVTFNVGAR